MPSQLDDNSDDEWSSRKARGVGARPAGKFSGRGEIGAGGRGLQDEDSSDEEGGGGMIQGGEAEDEGVFGGLQD